METDLNKNNSKIYLGEKLMSDFDTPVVLLHSCVQKQIQLRAIAGTSIISLTFREFLRSGGRQLAILPSAFPIHNVMVPLSSKQTNKALVSFPLRLLLENFLVRLCMLKSFLLFLVSFSLP